MRVDDGEQFFFVLMSRQSETFLNGQAEIGLLQNGIPSSVVAVWPTTSPNAGQAIGAVVAAPALLDQNAGRPMRLIQYNVTLQREIGRNFVVEAGFVGNVGVWEEATTVPATGLAPLSTLNALSQATLKSYGFTDFTSVSDAALLSAPISTLTAAQKAILANRGVSLAPYSNFPSNQTVRQGLLRFPQYTGLLPASGAPIGKNWYDALQINANKRFSHGLSGNINYTYSKALALVSTPDPYNRNLGKNLSPFDLPHQLRFSAQYEVPRVHSALPVLKNNAVSYALSGWGLGFTASYQSAPLVGLPTSSNATPISQFLGYGPGPAQLIPGMSPWSVDWTDKDGNHHTDPLDINCHCFDVTKTVVLNKDAFTNVPNGQFAANDSSIRSFRGFRTPLENANFGRTFRFKEKMSLNVRVEFTNIFNRTQFIYTFATAGQTTAINLGNFTSAPTTFASGANKGLYSAGFGTINPTAGTSGQRAGSFVARFQF